jgi:hypothetical protein
MVLGTNRGSVKSPTIAVKIALRELVFPFIVTDVAPAHAVLDVSTKKFESELAICLNAEHAETPLSLLHPPDATP